MADLIKLGTELEETLRLNTKIIAFKKLENAEELEKIEDVQRIGRTFTFCQVLGLVRINRWTVGVIKDDKMNARCKNLCGLAEATEKGTSIEAAIMATTWMPSYEESMMQQADYPRMAAGEAIVLSPLTEGKFDPEVVLIYGNVAQIMMLMCGLQKRKYENFSFSFLGEGDCSNSLGRCYSTGKISLGLGCYGERSMGQMENGEVVLAMPPMEMERALLGLKDLSEAGLKYPIKTIGIGHDPSLELAEFYPEGRVTDAIKKIPKQ